MVDKLEDVARRHHAARPLLVAELQKAGLLKEARDEEQGHGVLIPSYIALNVVAATPTEDARERVKELAEADAEVERVMSLSDAEVMAEADPSDVAWAQGVKLGTKIGMSAKAEDALRWYAEQVAGCRKIGRAGDSFRQALDQDGGQRARTALGNKETDRHG